LVVAGWQDEAVAGRVGDSRWVLSFAASRASKSTTAPQRKHNNHQAAFLRIFTSPRAIWKCTSCFFEGSKSMCVGGRCSGAPSGEVKACGRQLPRYLPPSITSAAYQEEGSMVIEDRVSSKHGFRNSASFSEATQHRASK
jgi:hypothetical protein